MAERLTPRTLDLEVGVQASPSRCFLRQGTLLHLVSLGQRNVMHVQSCCLVYYTHCLFDVPVAVVVS